MRDNQRTKDPMKDTWLCSRMIQCQWFAALPVWRRHIEQLLYCSVGCIAHADASSKSPRTLHRDSSASWKCYVPKTQLNKQSAKFEIETTNFPNRVWCTATPFLKLRDPQKGAAGHCAHCALNCYYSSSLYSWMYHNVKTQLHRSHNWLVHRYSCKTVGIDCIELLTNYL